MDSITLNKLIGAGTSRSLEDGRIIHYGDRQDHVFLLEKGLIKISIMNEDGREVIKYLLKPGSLFGEMALLENMENRDEYAVAIGDCEIIMIRADKVKELMKTDEELHKTIHKAIGKRMKKLEERMLSLMFMDVRQRVFNFLQGFVRDFGMQQDNGYLARNFLTHEDIAKLTATSRQTVTKMLSGMKKNGLIDYNSRFLKVYD